MRKPSDYDQTQAYGTFKALPAGGYICEIKAVEETKSSTGRDMLKISFDIAEGEYKGYYTELYKNDKRDNRKWSGVANQLVNDPQDPSKTNRGFKTFVTSTEESNPGWQASWGDSFGASFRGKKIGVIMGREQYEKQDGSTSWSTKAKSFRSVEAIRSGDFEIPEDKWLEGMKAAPKTASAPSASDPWMNIPDGVEDDGLPFN